MKFRSAAEARALGAPLVRLFVTGLARSPEPAELVPLVERLRAGDDLTDAAVAMAQSGEFTQRHGPDGPPDANYVRALFWASIGTDPPAPERDRLLVQPNTTRASLLAQISQQPATRAAVTLERHYYQGALPPDDDVAYQLWLEGGGETALPFEGEAPAVTITIAILATPARPDLLEQTLASLLAQTSPHWEALVVTDEPPEPAADRRIRHVAAPRREALARAAAEATGRLLGFIEASDLLAPQAIEAAARQAAANPGLRLLYTDEDAIAGDGTRSAATLKPGWSPDLMLSGDVLGQLVLFDTRSAAALLATQANCGEFALLDLALQLTADATPSEVVHQPGILFHRGRAQAGRPAPFPRTRASNGVPQLDAVIDRFLARHRPGLQRGSRQVGSRIWPSITATRPGPAPRVSVIIPTRDRGMLLAECLSGLLGATDYPDLEVLIVDNGSTEPDALALLERSAADPRVRVLRDDGPFNWSALNNRAAEQATGELLLLLNNDVAVLQPGWLRSMAAHAMRPGVGVVGARLLFPDGRLQHGGLLLGPRGAAVHAFTGAAGDEPGYLAQVMLLRDLSAVTGACMAIRRSLFHELGGLEQDHLHVAWSDVDLCLRAREAGYRVLWDPEATLVHHENATRGRDDTLEQQARFEIERTYMRRRWPEETERDPFLNPALRAEPDALVFRSVPRPGAVVTPAGEDLLEELQLQLAGYKRALQQAEAAADQLRRHWPRAELQHLTLDVTAKTAANRQLTAQRDALLARLAGLPPRLVSIALRLRWIPRTWRVLRRLVAVIHRTPRRRALLRQRQADYAVIAASPVFDPAWYRTAAMGGDQRTDAVSHYLWKGSVAGQDPHALFDSAWYGARTAGIGTDNPFAHYIRLGMAADADPHPLFDAAYYLAQAPEAAGRALLHHMQLPTHDTRSPARLFDPVDYPQGLAHWARIGAAEDRDPHALFATAWYRRTHLGGDRDRDPLAHWLREGQAAGLPPNPYGLDLATPPRLASPGPDPAATIIAERGPDAMATTRTLYALAQNSAPVAFEVILTGDGPAPLFGDVVRTAPDRRAAAAVATGRHLVFLGAGAIGHAGWLAALIDTADADPQAGAVGCKTLTADGALRSAGATVAEDGQVRHAGGGDPSLPHHAFGRLVDAVDGGAMLVRRAAWQATGGLDSGYATMRFAAADLAFSLRAHGWRVMLQPASVVTLPDAMPAGTPDDRSRFRQRWAATLSRQPAPDDALAGWRSAARRVLVLVEAIPADDSPIASAIRGALLPGTRVVLHALSEDGPGAAAWERRGLEILRSPALFGEWLAVHGPALDEVWSFRAQAAVPRAALLRWTGARLLHSPGDAPLDGAQPGTDPLATAHLATAKAAA